VCGHSASLPRQEQLKVSKDNDNMAIVGRWFASFWGITCIPDLVDEVAAPDILLQYSWIPRGAAGHR
jgi:hypothetical protein